MNSFPQIRELLFNMLGYDVNILSVVKDDNGIENEVFVIDFIFQGIHRKVILKKSCYERYLVNRFDNNFYTYFSNLLIDHSIPISNFISYKEYESSYYCIIFDYIRGETLIPEQGNLDAVIEFLNQLDHVPVSGFLQEHLITTTLPDTLNGINTNYVIVHGDFHPGNLVWNSNAISGVIDWDNVHVGFREEDVAHFYIDLLLLSGKKTSWQFIQRAIEELRLSNHTLSYFLTKDIEYSLHNYHKWKSGFFGKNITISDNEILTRLTDCYDIII